MIRDVGITVSNLAEYCAVWRDPVEFVRLFWPHVTLYDKQREMLYSVEFNKQTYVKSANMMGKDFIAGIIIVKNFLCHPEVRIVCTSVTDAQLKVLRAEVSRFIKSSAIPLLKSDGGILTMNYDGVKKTLNNVVGGHEDPTSYIQFMTTNTGEALAGHHAEWTLAVADEASGLTKEVKTFLEGWAKKMFIFGNPHECQNFYRQACDKGDILDDNGMDYLQKIIKIDGGDSPNVKAGRLQEKLGRPVEDIIKGVLSYGEYKFRSKMWDERRKTVGLHAEFYVGKELRLYPPEWVSASQASTAPIPANARKGRAIGVDPAEGGDNTAICCIDEYGVLDLESFKTTDTAKIGGYVLAMASKWNCPVSAICFDRGGGGKQISDRMRQDGYPVTNVAFGEAVVLPIKRVRHQTETRKENREDKSIYKSRRQQMYGELSDAIDPAWLTDFNGRPITDSRLFQLPSSSRGPAYAELLRQMSLVPRDYDEEGRLNVPPKRKKDQRAEGSGKQRLSLEEIMGCSPDELDALAIAHWRMNNKAAPMTAGIVG